MKLERFLFSVTFLSGMVFALDVQALGLGEATLASRLNEPLSLEIALLGASSDTATPIAKVVTGAEHAAVGVAASGLLSQLRVEISGDATRIRITTQQSIREPVLIFTLKVEYARERVMREYTLLLDPPGYFVPTLARAKSQVESKATAEETANAEPEQSADTDPRHFGPVKRGETLSKLGMRLRTPGVTWAQMTWALYNANPHAFVGADINKLRAGAFLRVPTATDSMPWSHREALALITGKPEGDSVAGRKAVPITPLSSTMITALPRSDGADIRTALPEDQTNPTAPATRAESESEPPETFLRLVTADDVDVHAIGDSAEIPTSTNGEENIHSLMAQVQKEFDSSREEILKSREQLADLAREITNLVKTVARKDAEIAGLENRFTSLQDMAGQQRAAMRSLESNALHRFVLEGLLLVGIIGFLAVMLSRSSVAYRLRLNDADVVERAPGSPQAVTRPLQTSDSVAEEAENSELLEEEPQPVVPNASELPTDHINVEHTTFQDDSLMEANAYHAYGYHEKAREVLTAFIKEHPGSAEGRLSMLRVLHAMKEKRSFRRHAEAFLELVDDHHDKRWAEIARLGRAMFPRTRLFDVTACERTGDEALEKTVWMGTRPDLENLEKQNQVEIDDVKYVDFLLIDEDHEPAEERPSDLSPTTSAESNETELELAKWRSDLLRCGDEKRFELEASDDSGDPDRNSADDERL